MTGRGDPGAGAALAWAGHPMTLAAVALLAVNDHLLKQAYPGFLTGKLSDVAGLVVAPALLAVAVLAVPGRRFAADRVAVCCIAATGVGFSAVKCTVAGSRVASDAWTAVAGPSLVRRDPTDLLALPALLIALWTWRHAARRPASAVAVRRVRALVLVPLAMLAVGASGDDGMPSLSDVGVQNGVVLVWGTHSTPGIASDDGGVSWRSPTPDEMRAGVQPTAFPPKAADCVPDAPATCYRIAGAMAVDVSYDGGTRWYPSYRVSAGRREFLRRGYATGEVAGATDFTARALAVVPRPDGYTVVVADSEDGLLVRGADGAWRRVDQSGQTQQVPLTGFGSHILGSLFFAGMAGWVCLFVAFATAKFVFYRLEWLGEVFRFCVSVLIVWLEASVARADHFAIAGMVCSVLLAIALVAMFVRWRPPLMPKWVWTALVGVPVLTAVTAAVPFLGWTVGRPDTYETAQTMSLVVIGFGAALSVLCGILAGRAGAVRPRP